MTRTTPESISVLVYEHADDYTAYGVLTGDATHSHLLKTCEVYKEICLSQLSKEEVEKTL